MIMRDTIFCAVHPTPTPTRSSQSIVAMEKAVQEYVPGYRLLQEPQIDEPSAATQGQTKVSIFVEVEGAGDYLPPYSGNLDIMTAAATQVGENIARSAEESRMTDIDTLDPHLVRHPRRRALGRARPAADRHLPARRVAPQAAPVHRPGGARHRRGARRLRHPGHRGHPRRRARRLVVQLRLLQDAGAGADQDRGRDREARQDRVPDAARRRHQGRHPRRPGQRRPDLPDRHPLHRGRRLDPALRAGPRARASRRSAS